MAPEPITDKVSAWDRLSPGVQKEFMSLMRHFHTYKKPTGKDSRTNAFLQEILLLLKYIDLRVEFREDLNRLIGICFVGPNICIQTRILGHFLGRSKSSINSGLQYFGYSALKNTKKAKKIILSAMPTLSSESTFMRMWSVRTASENSKFCLLSQFRAFDLPEIEPTDIHPEPNTPQIPTSNVNLLEEDLDTSLLEPNMSADDIFDTIFNGWDQF